MKQQGRLKAILKTKFQSSIATYQQLTTFCIRAADCCQKGEMPKYHFSQGKIRVEDGVYSPVLDQRPPDAGVFLIIPSTGGLSQQFEEAIDRGESANHDQEGDQENN